MSRQAAPTPTEELALHEAFVAVKTRLQALSHEDPIAQIGIAEADEGIRIWDKELKKLYEELLATPQSAPKAGTTDLERTVKGYASVLEKSLSLAGKAAEVAKVHKEHNGTVAIAQGLLAATQGVAGKTVSAAAGDLKDSLAQLVAQLQRIAESGHSVFDSETVKLGTRAWTCLDNAYDALGMCLRKAGISFDPIYANRPTTKTPLRIVLKTHPDPAPLPAKHRKGAKGKTDKPSPAEPNPGIPPASAKGIADSAPRA